MGTRLIRGFSLGFQGLLGFQEPCSILEVQNGEDIASGLMFDQAQDEVSTASLRGHHLPGHGPLVHGDR